MLACWNVVDIVTYANDELEEIEAAHGMSEEGYLRCHTCEMSNQSHAKQARLICSFGHDTFHIGYWHYSNGYQRSTISDLVLQNLYEPVSSTFYLLFF